MIRNNNKERLTGKKRRPLIPVLTLAGVVVLLAGGFFIWKKFFSKPEEEFVPQPMMEAAVRMDVEKLYNSKGKLKSGKEISSGLDVADKTLVQVEDVYVKVGDMVKEGDVLYTLDMSSVENELALQQQKAQLQARLDALEASAANRALTDAQYASADQYDSATKKLIRSAEDVNMDIEDQVLTAEDVIKYTNEEANAESVYYTLKSQYDSIKQSEADRQANADALQYQVSLLQAERDYIYGKDEADRDKNRLEEIDEELNRLTYDLAKVNADITQNISSNATIKEEYGKAEIEYEKAKANRETAEKAFKEGKKVIIKDGRLMEDLIPETNKGNRTVLNAEQEARENIEKQQISNQIEAIDTAEEIRKKQEMLDKGVITAAGDGMVTQVNVAAGKSFSGGDAVIISKMDRLHITAEIDEGHIADITEGMTVRIRTDSTESQVLTGKVTFCAPTPTSEAAVSTTTDTNRRTTQSSTNDKPTYRVEIELDEENPRLRIGMTAKLEFVIESAKDCIAVPNGCLITDPEGNSFVRLIKDMGMRDPEMAEEGGDAATEGAYSEGDMDEDGYIMQNGVFVKEVKVETGVTDGYFTQITSDNIEEGMMLESTMQDSGMADSGMLQGIY